MAESKAEGAPYALRVKRWWYAVVCVGGVAGCVRLLWPWLSHGLWPWLSGSAASLPAAMDGYAWWELAWWGLASLVLLVAAVAHGRHWVRYPRRPATVYADRHVLHLAVGLDTVVELPWESVRKVGVAVRPLGVSVWAEPGDIDAALAQLDQPTRAGVEGMSRRFQGRLRVPVWPTAVPAHDVAAELAARAGDRCPVKVASIAEDLGKPS